ncbi:MAG: 2-hydroxyacid dehydrogenase [Sedimentitalea sp.]
MNILFASKPGQWEAYRAPMIAALDAAGLDYDLRADFAPDQVDYVVYAPNSGLQDFTPFTRLRAVLSLWAGVETVVGNETLKVPLTRMVDSGLKQGMVEWVLGHTLRHHLGMDAHIVNPDHHWNASAPLLAQDRSVTVLGLGELGSACACALAQVGFDVTGWSRRAKTLRDVQCLAGAQGLEQALGTAEICVLLLPDTTATQHIINNKTLAQMPQGTVILNPGRGTLIDDDALLEALNTGHIGHATLDVFHNEPLPKDHPFWPHPQVTVTPHIASETRANTASQVSAENIKRDHTGQPLLHLVDRAAGY